MGTVVPLRFYYVITIHTYPTAAGATPRETQRYLLAKRCINTYQAAILVVMSSFLCNDTMWFVAGSQELTTNVLCNRRDHCNYMQYAQLNKKLNVVSLEVTFQIAFV